MVIIYIIIFSLISILKYTFFLYDAYDLAIFNQAFWNTLHGNPYWITVTFPHSYLADHASIWLVLLLPIYALFGHPITLLLLQSVVLGCAGIPLYYIALHFWNNAELKKINITAKQFALGVVFLWFINPFVNNINLFEFHLLSFFPLFLFCTIYAYLKENKILFITSLIISTTTREDTGLASIGLIIILILDWFYKKYKTKKPTSLFYTLSSFVIIILWTFVAYKIIGYFSDFGGTRYISHYSWFKSNIWSFFANPAPLVNHIFSYANINVFLGLLLPFIFLPLIKPKWFILSAVPIVAIFMLDNTLDHVIALRLHYTATIIPGLFIASILAFIHLIKNKSKTYIQLFVIVIIFSTVYSGLYLGPLLPKNISLISETATVRTQRWEDAKTKIIQGPLIVDTYLLPVLSSRKNLYDFYQIFTGKKEFTNIKYDLPCDIKNIIIDNAKIAHSTAASNFYMNGFSGIKNIEKTIACSPIENFDLKKDISASYKIYKQTETQENQKYDIKIDIINKKITDKNIEINGTVSNITKEQIKKLLLRFEIFEKNFGRAILYPIYDLTKQNTEANDIKFSININDKHFVSLFEKTKNINIYLVKNSGTATVTWLNTPIEIIDKPEIVFGKTSINF
jgi:uncharacterized membrane protein